MYDADMISHYIHDTFFNLLHLRHIRLHLDASIHHLQLLHHKRLERVHVLDQPLRLF